MAPPFVEITIALWTRTTRAESHRLCAEYLAFLDREAEIVGCELEPKTAGRREHPITAVVPVDVRARNVIGRRRPGVRVIATGRLLAARCFALHSPDERAASSCSRMDSA